MALKQDLHCQRGKRWRRCCAGCKSQMLGWKQMWRAFIQKLRGRDSSDFTSLETLKFKNPPFQHISMYYIWILEFSIFSDFPIYIAERRNPWSPCLLKHQNWSNGSRDTAILNSASFHLKFNSFRGTLPSFRFKAWPPVDASTAACYGFSGQHWVKLSLNNITFPTHIASGEILWHQILGKWWTMSWDKLKNDTPLCSIITFL